ncbi:hypothetical protein MTR67_018589 [Solanum verrucosum]|uniref:DNA mismatch repair protein Mlh1 C-terminal domain-containing protein n=1 Tax=Solanum verrucosum TaxID=315347 RepID=A0AAF0QSK6_SOLVR|nr:hypothetical protein MTR67_018589 [Solanum verrucosum]
MIVMDALDQGDLVNLPALLVQHVALAAEGAHSLPYGFWLIKKSLSKKERQRKRRKLCMKPSKLKKAENAKLTVTLLAEQKVDWEDEKICFQTIAAALGNFYAMHPPLLRNPSGDGLKFYRKRVLSSGSEVTSTENIGNHYTLGSLGPSVNKQFFVYLVEIAISASLVRELGITIRHKQRQL